jgi:hypothetical protein
MTENQALFLKDVLFRVKQFYYGVSDKPLSAAQMTAGEATEYVAALKEAEQSLCLPDRGRVLPPDADTMLLQLCKLTREALLDKNIRLAGDLSALGIRLLGVYTFPCMGRKRFWEKCMTPFREKHGEHFFAAQEEMFLAGENTALRLRPSFLHQEGRYYEDDADEALSVAHPVLHSVFLVLGVLLFLGSIVGFGFFAGAGLSLSSPWLILGYLGAGAFGAGLYSLAMAFIHQYMGHTLTLLLSVGGALAVLLSLFLAL